MEQLESADKTRLDLKKQLKAAQENAQNEKKLKDLNRQLEFQVDELMEQLENSDQARKVLKSDLQ